MASEEIQYYNTVYHMAIGLHEPAFGSSASEAAVLRATASEGALVRGDCRRSLWVLDC